jgi:hypothetical protein
MRTPVGIAANVAKVAGNLVTAWESGDQGLLETAVGEAATELGAAPEASALSGEYREMLLGVAAAMDRLLSAGQSAAFPRGGQWEACHDLLRHAQVAASAPHPEPQV